MLISIHVRSHAPANVQNVSSTAISSLTIHQYQGKSRNYHQFIAAGDDEGTLHILEVPRNLTKSMKNEVSSRIQQDSPPPPPSKKPSCPRAIFLLQRAVTKAFFEREERRVSYVKERKEFRTQERSKYDEALIAAAAATAAADAKVCNSYATFDAAQRASN